jgi:hypothetical protein
MSAEKNAHDKLKQRCRMLGHDVQFGYCRAPGSEKPCRKIADCWFETFDVGAWLRTHFSQAEIAEITSAPQDKRLTLWEMIQQAQRRAAENQQDPDPKNASGD